MKVVIFTLFTLLRLQFVASQWSLGDLSGRTVLEGDIPAVNIGSFKTSALSNGFYNLIIFSVLKINFSLSINLR